MYLDKEDFKKIGKHVYPSAFLTLGATWADITGHPLAATIGLGSGTVLAVFVFMLIVKHDKKHDKKIKPYDPDQSTWYYELYDEWRKESLKEKEG